MAISIASMSSVNLQTGNNLCKTNQARYCAESGMEIMRCVLAEAEVTSSLSTEPTAFVQSLASYCNTHLPANVTINAGDANQIDVPSFLLSSTEACTATIKKVSIDPINGDWGLQVHVLGQHQSVGDASPFEKTVQITYHVTASSGGVPFFEGAIVTKGALNVTGNAKILGVNHYSEANIHIDATACATSFTIDGSSEIGGTVSISDSDPVKATLSGAIKINQDSIPTWWHPRWGGPFDDDDIDILTDCHVFLNSPPIEYPVPNPQAFRTFAPVGGSSISGDQSHSTQNNVVIAGSISGGPYTINNAFIPANTNPSFNGDYTINGLIYIEQPNTVSINGSVQMNGVIVAEGDYENPDPINNTITIGGHTTNNGVSVLDEDPLFAGICGAAQGISILAPGFKVNIGATFNSINGGITANGICFTGDPQVTLGGPLINYSTETMIVANSTCLRFDLSNYQGMLNANAFSGEGGGGDGVDLVYVASEYNEL